MTLLRHSQLFRLNAPETFLWGTGIEDTFITSPWPKTGRTLDEYELTGHYERWREDVDSMAELGVGMARYGIPWHRVNPQRGAWNWETVDGPLERLLELGIEPIVDLVHYGLPSWIERAYLHPDYPYLVAEYASRVAGRFKGRIHAYTPLNEPRITAWYCGRIGWWPPFQRGWRGFVAVMLAVCRGIVETVRALQQVDPDILPVHVDATDLYTTAEADLLPEAAHRQDIVFLALDLVSGRIDESHALHPWLLRHGATAHELDWFQEHAIELPFVGLNLYPMFTAKQLVRGSGGAKRWTMPYASGQILEQLGRLYWERYQCPLFVSETASVGSVRRRQEWLDASINAVQTLRHAGVPMVGYTWWPMFALVTWAYRQGTHPPPYYLKQMGLWDLDESLRRIRTPLVDSYRALALRGCEGVGELRTAALTTRY